MTLGVKYNFQMMIKNKYYGIIKTLRMKRNSTTTYLSFGIKGLTNQSSKRISLSPDWFFRELR